MLSEENKKESEYLWRCDTSNYFGDSPVGELCEYYKYDKLCNFSGSCFCKRAGWKNWSFDGKSWNCPICGWGASVTDKDEHDLAYKIIDHLLIHLIEVIEK